MNNADQLLGRFFLDRKGATPRILEIRDYLEGVYLVADGDAMSLMDALTLSENIGDLFTSRDRAERARAQVMNALAARRPSESQAAEEGRPRADQSAPPRRDVERAVSAPRPASSDVSASVGRRRDDPAFVELVSAVLDLPPQHTRLLEAIVGDPGYRPHLFTQGLLAGHEVCAINLVDAQVGAGLDYSELVDVIVLLKKQSLVEVVSDALAPGRPELARFWLIVNPDCVDALASVVSPVGLVA